MQVIKLQQQVHHLQREKSTLCNVVTHGLTHQSDELAALEKLEKKERDDDGVADASEHYLRCGPVIAGYRSDLAHVLHDGKDIRVWSVDAYEARSKIQEDVFKHYNEATDTEVADKLSRAKFDRLRKTLETGVYPSPVYAILANALLSNRLSKHRFISHPKDSIEMDLASTVWKHAFGVPFPEDVKT
jgi:hypothetical protein